MDEFSKVMDQFGEEHHESADYLEQQTEKAVKMQKLITEITSSFLSSSRAAEVKLQGQWGGIHSSSQKPSKSTRTKKKSRSKFNGEDVKRTALQESSNY